MAVMTKPPRRSRKKPTEIDPGKFAKLVRMLASDKNGEVLANAGALRRALTANKMDMHDLAAAIEVGLRPTQQRPAWGPPSQFAADDWQSMCWFCHHDRHRLRPSQREFVEDLLLGRGLDDGHVLESHLQRLRAIVASLRAR
jgi:hypothetical protein